MIYEHIISKFIRAGEQRLWGMFEFEMVDNGGQDKRTENLMLSSSAWSMVNFYIRDIYVELKTMWFLWISISVN